MNVAQKYADHPEIIKEFLNYKLAIQGCSVKTVEEYALDLKNFFKYYLAVKQGKSPDKETLEKTSILSLNLDAVKNVKTSDIYEYLFFVTEAKSNASAAKARKLSSIKGFYKYLTAKRNYFEENPAINIESPKQKKALPKYLTLEESLNLLETVKNDKESKTIARDFAIITLFLNCGMRVSELVGLNLSDIQDNTIRVLGKGNKERILYLNAACLSALERYYPTRITPHDIDKNALFVSRNRNRINVQTVKWLVKKYLNLAGLDAEKYSAHKLRHTAATLMYQNGVDVRTLQTILGHSNLDTTMIYTHLADESVREAADRNPLSRVVPEVKSKE